MEVIKTSSSSGSYYPYMAIPETQNPHEEPGCLPALPIATAYTLTGKRKEQPKQTEKYEATEMSR
jgi:hypothetical protein